MNKLFTFFSIFFLISFLFRCHSYPNNLESSEQLQSYLVQNDLFIPENCHLYIFKSSLACKGCMSMGIRSINNYILKINKTNTTLVDSEEIDWLIDGNYNEIIDDKKIFERLNLDIYNFTLVWTRDKTILHKFTLTIENEKEFEDFLDSFYNQ